MTPPSDAVDRFTRSLRALIGPAPDSIGVAVSGGPDSLALLLLAHAAFPGAVRAATVDHGLRPESRAEAELVAAICAGLDVQHAILTAEVAPGGEGVQGEARRARYAALAEWAAKGGVPVLLTAHHADDQAETLLMRLRRGAGLAGLAGIRAVRELAPGVRLARPLLEWRRDELAAIGAAYGFEAVDDPSNRDGRFDRVRVRRWLAEQSLDPLPLARSVSALAEAEEALGWATERLWRERSKGEGGAILLDPSNLPAELVRRLVLRAVAPAEPRGQEVRRLIATLAAGGTATLGGTKCEGGPLWRFSPAPPRRLAGG